MLVFSNLLISSNLVPVPLRSSLLQDSQSSNFQLSNRTHSVVVVVVLAAVVVVEVTFPFFFFFFFSFHFNKCCNPPCSATPLLFLLRLCPASSSSSPPSPPYFLIFFSNLLLFFLLLPNYALLRLCPALSQHFFISSLPFHSDLPLMIKILKPIIEWYNTGANIPQQYQSQQYTANRLRPQISSVNNAKLVRTTLQISQIPQFTVHFEYQPGN